MKCCNLTLDMLDVTTFWLLAKTTYKALLRHVTHCTADKSNGIKLPATHFFCYIAMHKNTKLDIKSMKDNFQNTLFILFQAFVATTQVHNYPGILYH